MAQGELLDHPARVIDPARVGEGRSEPEMNARATFAAPDVVARVRKHFDVIGLEVLSDAEITDLDGRVLRVKDFAVKAKARLTPTMIFYGEGGRTLLHLVGQHPPDRFRAILDYLEGRHYESQTLRVFLAARAAPPPPTAGDIVRQSGLFAEPPHRLDRRAPGGRPLLVVFERPGCAPCESLHATVLRDASVRDLLRQFDAVQLNMADETTRLLTPAGSKLSPKAWADQLGLISVPALVFFDGSGTEVLRIDSETGRYRLQGALQYVLEKGYLEQPQFQQWRHKKALESRSNDTSGEGLRR